MTEAKPASSGEKLSIADLAALVKDVVGFRGNIVFDASKPDGTPRKRLDLTRLERLGWRARRALPLGLEDTYRWFLANCVETGR